MLLDLEIFERYSPGMSQNMEPGRNFNKSVKNFLQKREEDEWREQMKKKSKLRTETKIKSKLVLEKYVIEADREKRRQLTMIRGGTNKLRIETGRWARESENERVCNVCLQEQVEDEKHFLLACPSYVKERVEMFERIREECKIVAIDEMSEEDQLQILIGVGTKEEEIRDIVLDYLKKAYEIRKKYI